jgi:nitrogenase molybdenum-iron protein NifN
MPADGLKTTGPDTGRPKPSRPDYVSTTNACKLCTPMGAALVFRGIRNTVPFLHGSQGCATYMRRYLISHFREPVDIASSSLGEKHAVYGGGPNLKQGLLNVMNKYRPSLVGVATTCLTETIGDDVPGIVREFKRELDGGGEPLPEIVEVSSSSYDGTHMTGFHSAVRATVDALASGARREPGRINVLPGFVSPADLRYLKEVVADFGLKVTLLPDYSETLDGPALDEYRRIPEGGTVLDEIRSMGDSAASIELGRTLTPALSAAALLEKKFEVPRLSIGTPIGLRESDAFFDALASLAGCRVPERHALERGRLVDAYVDGHKYVFGKRAVVYGEEDLVVGLAAFLAEIGVQPVLCVSGGRSGRLQSAVSDVTGGICAEPPLTIEDADFYDAAEMIDDLEPDFLIGHSKGYRLAKARSIPLVRVGFPIHDRFGAQRSLHLGYRGTQVLLDRVVNAMIRRIQESTGVGYGYI